MQLSSVTYISPEQLCHWSTVFNGILDDLDLHGYGWQHGFLQTVKLVKTSPRSTLHQTNEDPPHGFHIYTLFIKIYSLESFFVILHSMKSLKTFKWNSMAITLNNRECYIWNIAKSKIFTSKFYECPGFFFLPHHSWRPAPVAQTVPPWPSQTLSSQYLQDHKDSLPAPCAYLYKDIFIMKILQKCYKDRKSYICTFDWKRVSCERTLHTMSSKF